MSILRVDDVEINKLSLLLILKSDWVVLFKTMSYPVVVFVVTFMESVAPERVDISFNCPFDSIVISSPIVVFCINAGLLKVIPNDVAVVLSAIVELEVALNVYALAVRVVVVADVKAFVVASIVSAPVELRSNVPQLISVSPALVVRIIPVVAVISTSVADAIMSAALVSSILFTASTSTVSPAFKRITPDVSAAVVSISMRLSVVAKVIMPPEFIFKSCAASIFKSKPGIVVSIVNSSAALIFIAAVERMSSVPALDNVKGTDERASNELVVGLLNTKSYAVVFVVIATPFATVSLLSIATIGAIIFASVSPWIVTSLVVDDKNIFVLASN
jgi:hypothetical protein